MWVRKSATVCSGNRLCGRIRMVGYIWFNLESIRTFHSNQAYFMHFLTLSVSFTSLIHLMMLLKNWSKGNTSQAVLFCLFSSRTIPLLITSHWNAGEENTSIKRVSVRIPLSQVLSNRDRRVSVRISLLQVLNNTYICHQHHDWVQSSATELWHKLWMLIETSYGNFSPYCCFH